MQTTMLLLAAAALLMPALFELVRGRGLPAVGAERVPFGSSVEVLSAVVAGLLIVTYALGLLFSLRTHRDLFNPPYEDDVDLGLVRADVGDHARDRGRRRRRDVGDPRRLDQPRRRESVGISEFFIGAVIVAIVGNAAEHWVAVIVARKDKMDLSVNIAIGSSAQIGLFVAPLAGPGLVLHRSRPDAAGLQRPGDRRDRARGA